MTASINSEPDLIWTGERFTADCAWRYSAGVPLQFRRQHAGARHIEQLRLKDRKFVPAKSRDNVRLPRA